MQDEKTHCRFCLTMVSDGNFKFIEGIFEEVLEVLLLKLSAEESKSVICSACSMKLFSAFKFKATCVDTEDSIFPYVKGKSVLPADLREIYLKERGKEHLKGILENERICRLCMQIVTGEFSSVEKMDVDTLRKYIPEINFSSTKEPIICKACIDSLNIHTSFLQKCLDVGEKIKDMYWKAPGSLSNIKYEDIEIKSEEHNYDGDATFKISEDELVNYSGIYDEKYTQTTSHTPDCEEDDEHSRKHKSKLNLCSFKTRSEPDLKKRKIKGTGRVTKRQLKQDNPSKVISPQVVNKDSSKVQMYSCHLCDYKTKYKYDVKKHQRTHKNLLQLKTYKCDKCDYGTTFKGGLTRHQLNHEDPSKVPVYKCDMCSYKSKRKESIVAHRKRHKDESFKCSTCGFETKYKGNFIRHQLTHSQLEAQTYQCDVCGYTAKEKHRLKAHCLTHNPSYEKKYKCDLCDYQTDHKHYFPQHLLTHAIPSNLPIYKCDTCDYKSHCKSNVVRHQLTHKDISEVPVHKCDLCDFKTKTKGTLKSHQKIHMDNSQTPTYKCDVCGFITIHKHNLKIHQIIHKDRSEVRMYKCDQCDFEAISKKQIRSHQIIHKDPSELETYKCDVCNFATIHKTSFSSHKLLHNNPIKYTCDICGYESVSKSNLVRHIRAHSKVQAEV